jgi:outer membrane protein assembly factor BamB
MWQRLGLLVVLANLLACSTSPSPVLPPVALQPLDNSFVIHKRWEAKLGDGASDQYLQLAPVIQHGNGYVADLHGHVAAFAVDTGKVLWQHDTGLLFASAPSISDKLLLLGTSHGEVVALDISTGEIRWQSTVSSEVLAPPQAARGIVVVRCVDGNLYGLSLANGAQLWVADQRTPALTLRGTSTPIIAGDIVLSGYDTGRLVAYTLQTGKVLWQTTVAASQGRTDLERMIDIDGDPIVVDDIVYVIAYQGRLAAVQVATGQIIWTRDLDSYVGMSIDAYRIYVTATDGVLWALDRNNGSTLWKQDGLVRRALTRPQLQKQFIIVGDLNGYLHWLTRDTGKLVARTRLLQKVVFDEKPDDDLLFAKRRSILTMPLVTDSGVITMDRQGHIEAFDVAYP